MGGGARLRAAGRAPQTLVCKPQPRRARRARSGPPPPGPVGCGPRLASPLAPPPAPPLHGRSPAQPRGAPTPGPPAEALGSSGSARGRSASAPGHPARLPASLGLAPAAAAASAHTHSRSNTQTHSCDSRGPEEAARRGDPPRPAPARLSCGDSTVPAARGGGARRQDGEGRREASRTPGRGLEAEISGPGRVPGSPRREEGRVERPGSPS